MHRMVRRLQGVHMANMNRSRAWRVVFYDSSIVYEEPMVTFSYKSLDNKPECTRSTTAAGITAWFSSCRACSPVALKVDTPQEVLLVLVSPPNSKDIGIVLCVSDVVVSGLVKGVKNTFFDEWNARIVNVRPRR